MRYLLALIFLATPVYAESFKLHWDAVTTDAIGDPIQGLDGYKLYVSTSPIKANWPVQVIPTITTQTDLVVNQTVIGKYYAVVTAFNPSGESTPSNEITFEVQLKSPGVPTNLKLVP